MAVANGAVQIAAFSAIFPSDQVLIDYFRDRARGTFEPVAADTDAEYTAEYSYDLGGLFRQLSALTLLIHPPPISATSNIVLRSAAYLRRMYGAR